MSVDANGWQPIETAPRGEGSKVVLWACLEDWDGEDDPQRGPLPARLSFQGIWWLVGGSLEKVCCATHWRPLPAPPVTTP